MTTTATDLLAIADVPFHELLAEETTEVDAILRRLADPDEAPVTVSAFGSAI